MVDAIATRGALVSLLVAAGCVRQLPPAATPAPTSPNLVADAPPLPGYGRLIVDVVDGPAPVERITMEPEPVVDAQGRTTFRFVEAASTLCAPSPCAVDVPLGNLLLGFPVVGQPNARETELLHVAAGISAYRRALSHYRDDSGSTYTLGIVGTAVGGTAVMTGAALLPIGLASDSGGLTIAGALSLGVGALMTTAGILAIRADAPTFRAGASNHFEVTAP